ncbi:hypothetical protein M6B38_144400 [Iris pallida]|uniref:Uncharacterized protein n=1 Tax=Iris pallida TaxID=29817 RepID=A0AAX6FAM0_IRIPA|nr:hypothetical protein M6B38_144400 [Iris pallida]
MNFRGVAAEPPLEVIAQPDPKGEGAGVEPSASMVLIDDRVMEKTAIHQTGGELILGTTEEPVPELLPQRLKVAIHLYRPSP